jgi:hypothetical protein
VSLFYGDQGATSRVSKTSHRRDYGVKSRHASQGPRGRLVGSDSSLVFDPRNDPNLYGPSDQLEKEDIALSQAVQAAELPWRTVLGVTMRNITGLADEMHRQIAIVQSAPPRDRVYETFIDPLFELSPDDRIALLFSNHQLVSWSASALSFLAAASILEDNNGVVQRSLETLLSALIDLSLALEDFCNSECVLTAKDAVALRGHALVVPLCFTISTELDNCIYRVVIAFRQYLQNFSFPPRIAARLEAYSSFNK